MKQNPRTPKTQKMAEEKVSNEAESCENSSSDDAKTLENEATEYEKQRELRIAQNKARMEAMGLRKIANSLMNLSQKKGEKRKSKVNSNKRAVKNGKEDDEYDPANEDEDDDDDDNGSDTSLNSSSEEFEEKGKNKKKKKRAIEGNFGCSSEKVKSRNLRYGKHLSWQNSPDIANFMDEDEALKQAIAFSLKDSGETSDLQQAVSAYEKSYDHSQEENLKRKRKSFKSRVQMTANDLVINFCQFDEVGKGNITLRDLQRMAASHDFTWTNKELVDMIRHFDSDRDEKLTLDDFRNIALRCNMLEGSESC